MNWKVALIRMLFAFFWLVGGGAAQIALFKRADNNYADALLQHPFMWFLYFFPAHIVTEQCLRVIRRVVNRRK